MAMQSKKLTKQNFASGLGALGKRPAFAKKFNDLWEDVDNLFQGAVYEVVTNLTALSGGGQTGATALTGWYNDVTTVAAAADSVLLPPVANGMVVIVKNSGAKTLAVFPYPADRISTFAANASVTLNPGSVMQFTGISTTTWEMDESVTIYLTGTRNAGDVYKGYHFNGDGVTLNNAAEELYGMYVDISALTNTLSTACYGGYFLVGATADGALHATDGTQTVTLGDGTNAISASGPCVLTGAVSTVTTLGTTSTITAVPSSDVAAYVVTGTNITSALAIDVNLGAKVSGGALDITVDTSTITGAGTLIGLTDSRDHDGAAADALVGLCVSKSGDLPQTSADANYTGIESAIAINEVGSGGAEGGTIMGFYANLTGAFVNGSAADVYGIYASTAGLTRTSANSVYGIYSIIDATDDAAIYSTDGTQTVALSDGTNAISASGPCVLTGAVSTVTTLDTTSTITAAPSTDVSAYVVTGTNITTGHVFDLNLALTTGSIMDMTAIASKTSGYLFNGNMLTSVLDATTILDEFDVACNHDGAAADTLRCIRRTWSGDMPNGTAGVDFSMFEGAYTGTFGTAATTGGSCMIYEADLSGAIINDANADVYGVFVTTSGITGTAKNTIYGVYSLADGTDDDAAICATDGTRVLELADGESHLNATASLVTTMPVATVGTGVSDAAITRWVPHGTRGATGLRMIINELYIDLTGLRCDNVLNDVIGNDGGTANAHFGQVTAANFGTVDTVEIICTETPAGPDIDIDFSTSTDGTVAETADITGAAGYAQLLARGGAWAINDVICCTALPAANAYLYLSNGAGGGGDADYTAGKFIVRFYGTV